MKVVEVLEEGGSLKVFRVTKAGGINYIGSYVGDARETVHRLLQDYQYAILLQKKSGVIYNGREWYASVFHQAYGPVAGVDGVSPGRAHFAAVQEVQRIENK